MIYIGDANDPATILADSKDFFSTYCASSPDQGVVDWINGGLGPSWTLGAHAAAVVQMYDLVAPLDRAQAARYLECLRQIAGALLDNRDDNRLIPPVDPVDPFRGRVMPAWGGLAGDRDGNWNTDVSTSALFTYAMAAFARRVADNPALHAQYEADAIRFVTATMETYEAFRQAGEVHLVDSDAEAYFTVPAAYAGLACNDPKFAHDCGNYRSTAGMPLAWNENFSMMKALAEAALAADSALYRGSPDVTPERLQLATEEVPLLIAKNVTFFVNHLGPNTLPDGTPYFEWDHQLPLPGIQDTGHGSFELGCLAVLLDDQIRLNALLARAGRSERVPLSPSLFERFANTFLRIIWHNDNTLNAKVNGKGDQGGKWNFECAGWIPLAQFDPWVWTRSRDTNYYNTPYLREDNHAALLRYRQFNSIKYLTDFAGQNWLITPAALAVGEPRPASIHDQKWLLVLSGVVIADLKGDNSGDWNRETVSFMPDMAGPDDPSSTSGPLNWAISHYSIPKPPGSPGRDYLIRFSLEQPQWAPFVSLSSIFNKNQSINSGFAVDVWRPNHFGSGTDVLTNHPVNNLFAGINADLAVRDTDAWIYRLSYNITLVGKIVFVAVRRTKSRAKS
jgi:hypothetical protein